MKSVLWTVLLAASCTAEEAAKPLELVGVTVERSLFDDEILAAHPELAARSSLTLWMDAPADVELSGVRIASVEGGEPLEDDVVRLSLGGDEARTLLGVRLRLPSDPKAKVLEGVEVNLEVTRAVRKVVSLGDIRNRKGEELVLPGETEPAYVVEGFGPKTVTMRRLREDVPPLGEIEWTNARGDDLAVNPQSRREYPDPSGEGWVGILVFAEHVPLEITPHVAVAAEPDTVRLVLPPVTVELP